MRRSIKTSLIVLLVLVVGACGTSPSTGPVTSNATEPATSQGTQPTTAAPQPTPSRSQQPPTTATSASVSSPVPQSTATPTSSESATPAQISVLDVHALPLGDGKVSTSPEAGYVDSCQTQFKNGGAQHTGSWIHGNTWDLTEKTSVEGKVTWPDAQFQTSVNGSERVITGNGLPVDSETGIFPIQKTDPAYQIDTNPNSIQKQNISFSLPLNPTKAASPSCVPMGMIGVALNGVAIFNALDASGRDAVAHETQDVCDGHPQAAGIYHYHGPSPCMPGESGNNQLIGYALDGFGIYSMYDANGKEITNANLDSCHGTTSEVMWNGKLVNMYHYVLTQEYPYTIGCFMGTPVRVRAQVIVYPTGDIPPTNSGVGNTPYALIPRQSFPI